MARVGWHCAIEKWGLDFNTRLYLAKFRPDYRVEHFVTPVWQVSEQGIASIDPLLARSDDEIKELLQAIVDAAWDFGVKPKGIKDFEGQNNAQNAHLKDMRALAAAALKVKLP